MDALLTLLFFVLLWGAGRIFKIQGRAAPEPRGLPGALSRGGGGAPETGQTPAAPAPPAAAGDSPAAGVEQPQQSPTTHTP